jgi:hypothetical protein
MIDPHFQAHAGVMTPVNQKNFEHLVFAIGKVKSLPASRKSLIVKKSDEL